MMQKQKPERFEITVASHDGTVSIAEAALEVISAQLDWMIEMSKPTTRPEQEQDHE